MKTKIKQKTEKHIFAKAVYRCGNQNCRAILDDTFDDLLKNKSYICGVCGHEPRRSPARIGFYPKALTQARKNQTSIGAKLCYFCHKYIASEKFDEHLVKHGKKFIENKKIFEKIETLKNDDERKKFLKKKLAEYVERKNNYDTQIENHFAQIKELQRKLKILITDIDKIRKKI